VIGEKKGAIYTIALNRPRSEMLSALRCLFRSRKWWRGLSRIRRSGRDPQGRGAGLLGRRGFQLPGRSGGQVPVDSAAGGAVIRADIHKFQQYLNRLESIEVRSSALFTGRSSHAVELALACDIRS